MVIRRLFAVAAVLALAGCAIDKQNAPSLTGPSELSLAIAVTATPDLILPDGASVIDVRVLDASGSPVASMPLRFKLLTAFGSLSASALTTDGAGRATVVYTAPSAGGPVDTLVTIEITTTGTNAQNPLNLPSRTIAVRVRS